MANLLVPAFKIASVLHSGFQAVEDVDSTRHTFHGEVTVLVSALDSVGETCKAPKLNDLDKESSASDGRSSTVLQNLRRMLTDCKETLS